jgi:hypothetical protein
MRCRLREVAMICLVLCPGCRFPRESAPQPEPSKAQAPAPAMPVLQATPFVVPGLRRPPTRPAALAGLADDSPVIGVLAGGRPRAYLLGAMTQRAHHVVDDVVGETPVTVTYCDQADCVRVFTADTPGKPLPIDLGGWDGKAMLLRVDGVFYRQDTGKGHSSGGLRDFPYAPLPFERTTWGVWKEAHPDTDVFTG